MIDAVIFDFGKVLVQFEPEIMMEPYIPRKDFAAVGPVLFDRLYWDRLDAGTIEDEEVVASVAARLPARLAPAVRECYYHWIDHLPEIPGMRAILDELTARGVPVFVISNISRHFAANVARVPILSYARDAVFSAVCGMTKPGREIFLYACDRFGYAPERCLFIDDSPRNIAGAEMAGLQTYLFDGDAGKLAKFLKKL